MTRYITVILGLILLSDLAVTGQTEGNYFKIEDGALIWQRIYPGDTTLNVTDLFISAGILDNILTNNNQIMGDLKPFDIDYRGIGYTRINTSSYLLDVFLKGYLTVDIKPDRYRVTIKDIRLVKLTSGAITSLGDETNLGEYAIKGTSDFRPSFLKSPSVILNHSIEKRIKISKTEDNW